MLNSNFNRRTVKCRSLAGKTLTLLLILFAAVFISSRAQDTWIQKSDIGGPVRIWAVGFSIGSKGYVGTGNDSYHARKDFWEYDPTTNAWTQKADYGGGIRYEAVGFSIGNKGYIGTGVDDNIGHKDFWEYDPATNAWTQKADYAGLADHGAVGFSIGSKGYMGTGFGGGNGYTQDFWEYDPATDIWTHRAKFGGGMRYLATGFSIGGKGYIGTGDDGATGYNDLWEYDPATNSWTQKASYNGQVRASAVGFSIGSKGYMGTGLPSLKDFWEYDPATNAWIQKGDFAGPQRNGAIGFSIGSKGYIGTGFGSLGLENDFWEYTPGCIAFTLYADEDGDGYGDLTNSLLVGNCTIPDGYVYDSTDCNDGNAAVNPAATEVTNGIDDNCNGVIDDVCVLPASYTVVNITSSSAKLKWDAVAGAVGYTVRYKVSNTGEWKYGTTDQNSKPISGLLPNTLYKWEVKTFCQVAPGVMSGWSSKQQFTTGSLRMYDESPQQISFQIYPNPANDHATIQFTLPQASHVGIKIFDVSGKEIATLLNDTIEQGEYSVLINTNEFSKGVYSVRMIGDYGTANQKLIVQ